MDTSVWIDHMRGLVAEPHVQRLRAAFGQESIIVGDLILLEILQGVRSEQQAATVEHSLRQFAIVNMLDDALAVRAASHNRTLRMRGITTSRTTDLIIGTYCIHHALPLLHHDEHFNQMEKYLGLPVVSVDGP